MYKSKFLFLAVFSLILIGYGSFGISYSQDSPEGHLIDSMIRVESDNPIYHSGETITITVNSLWDPNLNIEVTVSDLEDEVIFSQNVTTDPDSASFQFSAPDKTGTYYVNAYATKWASDLVTSQTTFEVTESSSSESEESRIPDWIKNTMQWYLDGLISEDEMISAIQFLVNEGIIKLD